MTVAPEPYLSACLNVLQYAILQCRIYAWSNEISAEHVADLMDAVHNIPTLIRHWETCDVELLREEFLRYEQKWRDRGGSALCKIFDDGLTSQSG